MKMVVVYVWRSELKPNKILVFVWTTAFWLVLSWNGGEETIVEGILWVEDGNSTHRDLKGWYLASTTLSKAKVFACAIFLKLIYPILPIKVWEGT